GRRVPEPGRRGLRDPGALPPPRRPPGGRAPRRGKGDLPAARPPLRSAHRMRSRPAVCGARDLRRRGVGRRSHFARSRPGCVRPAGSRSLLIRILRPVSRNRPVHGATPSPRGHRPTLVAAFLHFDLSFMLWVLLGALGVYIAESAGLSPAQKGVVVATPLLSGALLRIPLGLLSDRFGSKPVGAGMLAFLGVPLLLGWLAGDDLPALLGIGLLLGTAGASFAVALPLASRWYPAERQGLVMGIAAAGNSGTVLANLIAPRLAEAVGWHNV